MDKNSILFVALCSLFFLVLIHIQIFFAINAHDLVLFVMFKAEKERSVKMLFHHYNAELGVNLEEVFLMSYGFRILVGQFMSMCFVEMNKDEITARVQNCDHWQEILLF